LAKASHLAATRSSSVMADRRRPRSASNPKLRNAPLVRLQINALASGGCGLARAEIDGKSRSILVPMTAPGDEVLAELSSEPGAPRARVVRVLTASRDRVVPPCPYVEQCGGCDLMHLSVDAQRRNREALVLQRLEHIPGLDIEATRPSDAPCVVQIHHAAPTERYRSRLRLGAVGKRGRVIVGFRAPRSHDLIEVDTCLVATSTIDEARKQMASWLDGSTGCGDVTLQPGTGGLPTVHLQWKGELAPGVFSGAEQSVAAGAWAGAEIWLDGATQPAVIGDPEGVTRAFDGSLLRTAPGGFAQAHEAISALLVARVAQSVPEGASTLELFCGAGNMTIALAQRTERLEAVEGDERALAAARKNLAARGLRAKLIRADAADLKIASHVRVVVLDPPRVGAPDACRRIAASRARRVVMVSCDPATLARDIGLLQGDGGRRWRAVSIDLFEMFPHTSHIETLVVLDRTSELGT